MIPRSTCENAEEFDNSLASAAPGAENRLESLAGGGAQSQGNATASIADPDVALVVDRWATLPEHLRLAIMALVRSAS